MEKSFGDRVRAARAAAGLTQEDLARQAGLALAAVTKIEAGTVADPKWSTVCKLATVLKVDLRSWMVSYDAEPAAKKKAKRPSK